MSRPVKEIDSWKRRAAPAEERRLLAANQAATLSASSSPPIPPVKTLLAATASYGRYSRPEERNEAEAIHLDARLVAVYEAAWRRDGLEKSSASRSDLAAVAFVIKIVVLHESAHHLITQVRLTSLHAVLDSTLTAQPGPSGSQRHARTP